VIQNQRQYDRNPFAELVLKSPGYVADNGQLISSCEGKIGDVVCILQLQDNCKMDAHIDDHFIMSGKVIEAALVNKDWPMPFEKMPPRLVAEYHRLGYRCGPQEKESQS
jgi:hypothetical protein